MRCAELQISKIEQTAACNALHNISSRMTRGLCKRAIRSRMTPFRSPQVFGQDAGGTQRNDFTSGRKIRGRWTNPHSSVRLKDFLSTIFKSANALAGLLSNYGRRSRIYVTAAPRN
jgi:hypothetical protein